MISGDSAVSFLLKIYLIVVISNFAHALVSPTNISLILNKPIVNAPNFNASATTSPIAKVDQPSAIPAKGCTVQYLKTKIAENSLFNFSSVAITNSLGICARRCYLFGCTVAQFLPSISTAGGTCRLAFVPEPTTACEQNVNVTELTPNDPVQIQCLRCVSPTVKRQAISSISLTNEPQSSTVTTEKPTTLVDFKAVQLNPISLKPNFTGLRQSSNAPDFVLNNTDLENTTSADDTNTTLRKALIGSTMFFTVKRHVTFPVIEGDDRYIVTPAAFVGKPFSSFSNFLRGNLNNKDNTSITSTNDFNSTNELNRTFSFGNFSRDLTDNLTSTNFTSITAFDFLTSTFSIAENKTTIFQNDFPTTTVPLKFENLTSSNSTSTIASIQAKVLGNETDSNSAKSSLNLTMLKEIFFGINAANESSFSNVTHSTVTVNAGSTVSNSTDSSTVTFNDSVRASLSENQIDSSSLENLNKKSQSAFLKSASSSRQFGGGCSVYFHLTNVSLDTDTRSFNNTWATSISQCALKCYLTGCFMAQYFPDVTKSTSADNSNVPHIMGACRLGYLRHAVETCDQSYSPVNSYVGVEPVQMQCFQCTSKKSFSASSSINFN